MIKLIQVFQTKWRLKIMKKKNKNKYAIKLRNVFLNEIIPMMKINKT